MIFFLSSHSLWLSATLLVGLPAVLAAFGPALVRRCVGVDRLTINNEIAGFKFAVIGVLYAVLMAFAVIVVWEKYKDADALVSQEGSAAATIYRLSQGLEPQPRATLRRALTNYLNAVISRDWPAMQDGATSGYSASQNALDGVYAALLPSGASQPPNSEIWLETLRELDTITQARRARLGGAEGVVPSVIWPALIWRCHHHRWLHLFLRRREFAGANGDDHSALATRVLAIADRRDGRQSI